MATIHDGLEQNDELGPSHHYPQTFDTNHTEREDDPESSSRSIGVAPPSREISKEPDEYTALFPELKSLVTKATAVEIGFPGILPPQRRICKEPDQYTALIPEILEAYPAAPSFLQQKLNLDMNTQQARIVDEAFLLRSSTLILAALVAVQSYLVFKTGTPWVAFPFLVLEAKLVDTLRRFKA